MPLLFKEVPQEGASATAVSNGFVRFPHTPHLAWLGGGTPRDDKVLSLTEANALLSGEVVVEEKVDGANLGLSLDTAGQLQAQNRGQFLMTPIGGQFVRLPQWLAVHGDSLKAAMSSRLIMFGEWCAARHSLGYDRLPDWWLVFDVYDRDRGCFLPIATRNEMAMNIGLAVVAEVFRGHATLASLKRLLTDIPSRYRDGPMEGIVVRSASRDALVKRAKLVRPDFTQAIESHWRKRRIEWNRLDTDAPGVSERLTGYLSPQPHGPA